MKRSRLDWPRTRPGSENCGASSRVAARHCSIRSTIRRTSRPYTRPSTSAIARVRRQLTSMSISRPEETPMPVRERLPGPATAETRSTSESLSRIAVFGVLALVFLIRLAHLSSAMVSPLTYQPGPDEDYYPRFGLAVARGQGQDSPEFTFMDPAYGYILGAIFRGLGPNLFVVYLLQVVLDTVTAYGILRIGRLLGRPPGGLVGALLYGLTSTPVMFCPTLLKEVWVTAFLTWWVVGALALIRSRRPVAWLL